MSDCQQCGHALPHSSYADLRWKRDQVNIPVRCVRCGMPHVRGERLQPLMLPVDRAGRTSPWQGHHTRPPKQGMYECRFRSIEPQVSTLYWNGSRFVYQGQVVSMRDFMGWRGRWE